MSRFRLITYLTATGIVLLCATLLITIYALAATTPGARWLLSKANQITPQFGLQFENISGTLYSGLELHKLQIETDTVSLSIDTFKSHWQLRALLYSTISITNTEALGVHCIIHPSEEPQENTSPVFTNFDLPLPIALENILIANVTIARGEQLLPIKRITLQNVGLFNTLTINNLTVIKDEHYQASLSRAAISSAYPYKSKLELLWQADLKNAHSLQGSAKISGDLEKLTINHTLQSPIAIESEGTFEPGVINSTSPKVSLAHNAKDIQWQYTENKKVIIPTITAKTEGWLNQYSVMLEGISGTNELPKLDFSLTATGDQSGLQTSQLLLNTLGGQINANGILSWTEGLFWDYSLNVKNINPGTHWSQWQSSLTGKIKINGSYEEQQLSAAASIESLTGNLRNYKLNAKGNILYKNEQWTGRDLKINLGNNSIIASGTVNDRLNADWQINAPNLQAFWPELQGELYADGTFSGSLQQPLFEGKLQAKNIQYNKYSVENFNIYAARRSSAGDQKNYIISNQADNIHINDFVVKKFTTEINGEPERHTINVQFTTDYGSADLQTDGHWSKNLWHGTLNKATIHDAFNTQWDFPSSTVITIGKSAYSIDTACWIQSAAKICLAADIKTTYLNASASLSSIPLNIFKPLLQERVSLNGLLNGDVEINGELTNPSIQITLAPEDGNITIRQIGDDDDIYAWRNANINLDHQKHNSQLTASILFPDQGQADLALTIDKSDAINGELNFDFEQLNWLEAWTPQLRDINGKLKSKINFSGNRQHPTINGAARLLDASATISQLGTTINNINAELSSTGKNNFLVHGAATSGTGQIDISGEILQVITQSNNNLTLAEWQAKLKLQGKEFEAINTKEAHIIINPDLNIAASSQLIDVQGLILVPTAEITIDSLPKNAVKVSDDAIILGQVENDEAHPDGIPIATRIKLQLGKQVHFQGFGLETRLSGNLEIIEESKQPTLAYGQLNIEDGRYKAYGQKLSIERGALIFQGPYQNPGLDIRATRKAEDITVGLQIGGTLKNIQSSIFSEPALAESEAIAILITGKPLDSASETDANALIEIIATLGLKKGEGISNQISKTFGLDVLTIDSQSDLNQSSLLIGKYLTPRLYVRYAVGLFDQTSNLALDYKLSKRTTLEAQSGKNQSMDIIYRIER